MTSTPGPVAASTAAAKLAGGCQPGRPGIWPEMQIGHDHDPTAYRDVYSQQVGDIARGSQRGR